MKMIISRTYGDNETQGRAFLVDGNSFLYTFCTLELPWKNNQRMISCIPEGHYVCNKMYFQKLGNTFQVNNVIGRDGILIHIGNYAAGKKIDTEGCILVGTAFMDINGDGNMDIADSGTAINRLMTLIGDRTTFDLYIV